MFCWQIHRRLLDCRRAPTSYWTYSRPFRQRLFVDSTKYLAALSHPSSSIMSNNLEARYEAAIDAGAITGAIVCAVNASGDFSYKKALGHRILLSGEKAPLQLDDIIFIASGAKLLTTIAALQCVEDGLLTLSGDLSSIAPELASRQIITGWSDADDKPLLEASSHPITLEMLLTHSAGLTYYFTNPLIGRWQQKFNVPSDKTLTVEEMYNQPLSYQPGTGWMYGSGVDWAGRIVERVTGSTLGEFIQNRICVPLGISDSQFYPIKDDRLRARLVDLSPSDPEGLGKAVFGGNADVQKIGQGHFGGHGLFLEGSGFIKIQHSLLANDGILLQPSTVVDMFRNHLSPESTSQIETAVGPVGSFLRMGTDKKVGWGLGGLLVLEDTEGGYGKHTLTWGGGVTFTWFIDRSNDLCGFTALQATLPVQSNEITALKDVFRREIYQRGKHSSKV
ncbi:beta-lactamase [Stachybotrys elegans]|uniref:Beta-lactamase n=1 Tax=Stachybotrys elegans TaxID=80388 RepID=A0A8K0SWX8_9HYPO|nr:beta-lactamase [Stachybotrys elegans]